MLGKPVHELMTWPASVISYYQAYDSIEPIGHMRADIHNAAMLNCFSKEQISPFDYMPSFDRQGPGTPRRETEFDTLEAMMRAAHPGNAENENST